MFKKTIFILSVIFFTTSCSDTLDSVKRGLTGQKAKSTDEFFVKKKDPLILPPDYENIPTPDERIAGTEEISIFEKTLETGMEEDLPTSSSVEDSIIKKFSQSKCGKKIIFLKVILLI